MNIREKISQDFITAFKNRETEKKNFLGLIKSTIDNESKSGKGELDDDAVLRILSKFEKNILEVLSESQDQSLTESATIELNIVKAYMPTKLTEVEIKSEIEKAIAGGANNIGGIMSWFKDKQADKKMVSNIANTMLFNKINNN